MTIRYSMTTKATEKQAKKHRIIIVITSRIYIMIFIETTETKEKKMNIFTLATMEHETSQMVERHDLTMAQAYSIAKNGGFYKAQIINQETMVVEYEF